MSSHAARSQESPARRFSQLCKPLWECLHDQAALSVLEYLIQFMAARDALHLLQFWFSVASFKSASHSSSTAAAPLNHSHTLAATSVVSGSHVCAAETRAIGTVQSQPMKADHNSLLMKSANSIPTSLPTTPDNCTEITPTSASCHSLGGSASVPIQLYKEEAECDSLIKALAVRQMAAGDDVHGGGGASTMNGVGGGREGDVTVGREGQGSVGGVRNGRPEEITRQTSLNVVTDAMGIYSTYIALNAVMPVGIPDDMRQRVEISICPEDGIVDRTCFNEAQKFVYNLLENRYYPEFLRSSFLCKYQLELVSSGRLCLLDFLLGGDALVYFMEFMEQEDAMSLLQFWLIADSFHAHVASLGTQCDSEPTIEDAMAIYDRYFSLQATEPLGLGDSVRVEIETRICDERGPQVDSFVTAQHIAHERMIETYYPNFLESGIYLKFLNDLLRMVKLTPAQPVHQHVATDGSDLHNSSAGSSSRTEAKTVHYFTCDADDPESLWRRPQMLMQLGCVDSMGQYCSEIEPFPTKTAKSREQPKQFRRFKNRQEEEEWELAVKIARSIVTKVLKRTSRNTEF